MSVKRRVCKLEKKLRQKGKIPPGERVRIFFDDGSGSVIEEMGAEKALLMKKYSSDGFELIFVRSEIPEPRPLPGQYKR